MRDKADLAKWPRDIIAVLSALAALLIYFQYTTLFKFAVLAPARWYHSLAIFVPVVKRNVQFDPSDAILAGLIVALFVTIIVLELRKKRLSTFLSMVFETEKRTILLLIIACLFLRSLLFRSGRACMGRRRELPHRLRLDCFRSVHPG